MTESTGGADPFAPIAYHPAVSDEWTARSPAGGGVASVTGGELVLTQPASPSTGDAYRASLFRDVFEDVPEGGEYEVSFRLNSFSSDNQTLLSLQLRAAPDGTASAELRLYLTNAGAVSLGYLDSSASWHAIGSVGTVALDGTGYLTALVRERDVTVFIGSGDDPAAVTWTRGLTLMRDQEYPGGWGGASPAPLRYWGVALTAYGPTIGAEANIDHATIRRV